MVTLAGILLALLLPPIYKSTSTILIEEQDVPQDFVMTTVTGYAEQRIETITQRIMSTGRLLEIINQFNLYADLREKRTTEEVIETMREDVLLEPISTEVVDHRTGRLTSATIAFTLSYEGRDPHTVQKVANMMASLYLEENMRVRKRQASETSAFIADEMQKVKTKLDEIEARIAEFKETHFERLPEILHLNIQTLTSIEQSMERLESQLRSYREHQQYLKTQMAGIPMENEQSDNKKRLEMLKAQMVHLKSRFTDEYPDIVKLRSEIAELETHVDKTAADTSQAPDNPAYVALASQLSSTESEIASIRSQLDDLRKKAEDYRSRIEATPKVEQTYNLLLTEKKNTQAKYDDLMRKFMEADVARGLEAESKGERFTLIDPAQFPEKPYKPNRWAIMVVGFIIGCGIGFAVVSIAEINDQTVQNPESLVQATALPVLVSVPCITTRRDDSKKRILRYGAAFGFILLAAGSLFAFHYFVMDLNLLWIRLMHRLAI